MENPIELTDIEDVSIVIHTKGQKWLVMTKTGEDKEMAKEMRKLFVSLLVTGDGLHSILDTPLTEELFTKLKQNLKDK